MKKKTSKLLASLTAAAMAVMCAVVAVPAVEVSAAEDSLAVPSDGMLVVTPMELEKYSEFTFEYAPKKADECGHKNDGHGDATPEYCIWCGVAVVGSIKTGADTEWWVPTSLKAATGEDAASCTATVTRDQVISAIEATDVWKDSSEIAKITFQAQDCTFSSIKAKIDSNYVELKSDEWTKTAEGTYAVRGLPAGENPDYNTGSAKPGDFKIPVADLLPEGKTVDDIESISADVTVKGGDANGQIASNVGGEWKSKEWNNKGELSLVWDTADDFSDVTFQINYLGFGVKVTVQYSVKCKESTTPSTVDVVVTPHEKTLKVGETVQLSAEVTGKDDAKVTWTSNDVKIASVDETGKVTAVGKGSVEIWPLVDGKKVNSNTAFALIKVEDDNTEEPKPDEPKPDEPKPDEPKVEVNAPENNTGVAVEADAAAIKGAVELTDDEKAKGVTLNLKVENAVLDAAATEAVNKEASAKGITASDTVLDIKLVKTVDGTASDVKTLVKPISITVDVPAALINNDSTKTREYFVIHYHDGKADVIGGTFADGKFTFSVDGFSAFVLAYKDTPNAIEPPVDPDAKTYSSSVEINADGGWGQVEGEALPLTKLIGSLDPAKVKTITFEGEGFAKVGYKGKADGKWTENEAVNGKVVLDFSGVNTADFYFVIAATKTTIVKWTATTEGSSAPVDPKPEDPTPEPTYAVTVNSGFAVVTGDRTAGSEMTVSMPIGFVARVYNGNTQIATIYDGGKFTMPAGNVTIYVTDESGAAMMAYTAPNSYIFSYDSSMKLIKTNRSKKGIKGTGEMTVDLGAAYAGKTATLYTGKASTSGKIETVTLDSNGRATFTVQGAKNYSLVVED